MYNIKYFIETLLVSLIEIRKMFYVKHILFFLQKHIIKLNIKNLNTHYGKDFIPNLKENVKKKTIFAHKNVIKKNFL